MQKFQVIKTLTGERALSFLALHTSWRLLGRPNISLKPSSDDSVRRSHPQRGSCATDIPSRAPQRPIYGPNLDVAILARYQIVLEEV